MIIWNKPEVGNRNSVTSQCGKYCIRRDSFGFDVHEEEIILNYVPLVKKGRTWQQIGLLTSEDAKRFIQGVVDEQSEEG